MIKSFATFTLIFATAFAPSLAFAAADEVQAPDSVAELPSTHESIVGTYLRDVISPFTDPTSLSIFAGGTVATLTLLATHTNYEDQALDDVSQNRPLGDYSKYGDYAGQLIPNIAYFSFYLGKYWFTNDPLSRYRAEMMFRATLAANTMSTFLKATVREPRPKVENDLTSFPSGHATSIFTFATVVAAMHGPYWGAGAYAIACYVAYSRMNDNRHRLHDVVAGATIGSMYGISVYQRMRDNAAPSLKTAKFNYQFVPVATEDGAMLGLAADF